MFLRHVIKHSFNFGNTLSESLLTSSQLSICTNSSLNISFMSSCVSSVVHRVESSAKMMNLNTVHECIMPFI